MTSKNIGIIGSGISGLACASFLADKGYAVTIYEREQGTGGLAGSAQVNGVPIEMFYHHFFASDTELLAMAKELGVYNAIHFYDSSVGFYIDKKLYPFTTPLDLLKFTPLPFIDRVKMGLTALYFIKRKSWDGLEKWTCKEFFDYIRAPKLYEIMWKPLLKMKFGEYADTVPATFLWGRINPRGRSRKGSGEQLGYFDNGYHTFFSALEKSVTKKGVHLKYESVEELLPSKTSCTVKTVKSSYQHDAVIFTGSNVLLTKMCKKLPDSFVKKTSQIHYQAINCMILELKKSLSPYYWLNVLDTDISFIGFIEHTNLVPKKMYGRHVVYVFNYLQASNPIYTMKPEDVFDLYTKDIKKIFPQFKKTDVINWQLARNPFATPIYNGKYSKKMPPIRITDTLFLANTSQVYPEDRNVNNGIVLAKKVVSHL